MTLFNKFLELNIPETTNPKLFNALTLDEFPFSKIGISNMGFPVILLSSTNESSYHSQKNVRLKYIELTHNLECKISENEISKFDYFSVIVFKSEQADFISYFLGMADILLHSLSKNPSQKEIFETFTSFVEIFRSLSQAPTKTLQGLWAELLLIEKAKNPEILINYWHAYPDEKFDFNADIEKIEVKSSCNLTRVHIFSSEQLTPPEDKQILIASIFTKQTSSGITITDLLHSIQNRIDEQFLKEKLLTIVIKTLGHSFEQGIKIKYDYDLAINSLRFYRYQDISKIEKVNIPERVSEVKYKSDLTDMPTIKPDSAKNSGTLFNAI